MPSGSFLNLPVFSGSFILSCRLPSLQGRELLCGLSKSAMRTVNSSEHPKQLAMVSLGPKSMSGASPYILSSPCLIVLGCCLLNCFLCAYISVSVNMHVHVCRGQEDSLRSHYSVSAHLLYLSQELSPASR